MKIERLKTNHVVTPLGFALRNPVFSFVVTESTGRKQKAAQIRVASDEAQEENIYLKEKVWGELDESNHEDSPAVVSYEEDGISDFKVGELNWEDNPTIVSDEADGTSTFNVGEPNWKD